MFSFSTCLPVFPNIESVALLQESAGVQLSCDTCFDAEEKSRGRDLTGVTVLGHVRFGSVVRKISNMSREVEKVLRTCK